MLRCLFYLLLIFNCGEGFSQEYQTDEITVYEYTIDRPGQTLYSNYQDPVPSETNLDIYKELSVNANLLLTKTNAFGGVQNLYLRGSSADQLQISYDGAVLNDPSNPSRGYNFAELSSFTLSSIDIFYGPHATSVGSFANAGALNLKSRNVETPVLIQKIGSYETLGSTILMPVKKWQQQWEWQNFSSRGMSAYSQGDEHDGMKDYRFKVQGKSTFLGKTKMRYFLLGRNRKEDLDFGNGTDPDDSNYISKESMLLPFAEISGNLSECNEWSFKGQKTIRKRETNNEVDAINSNQSFLLYRSTLDIYKFNMENNCFQNSKTFLNVEYNKETMSSSEGGDSTSEMSKKSQKVTSVSLNQDYNVNAYNSLLLGLKLDFIGSREQLGSYRFAYNKALLKNYFISPSYAYSRKIPSLYQLYSEYGNSDLQREESSQLEVVFKKVTPQVTLEVVPFFTQYDQMIDFNLSTNKYSNVGRNKIFGAEFRSDWKFRSHFGSKLNINYLRAYNQNDSKDLLLRPRWQGSEALYFTQNKKSAAVQIQYIGNRQGLDPIVFTRLNTPSIFLVHALTSYEWNTYFKIDLSVQNIFNKKYNFTPGNSALGLSVFTDLTYSF